MINNITKNSRPKSQISMQAPSLNTTPTTLSGFASFIEAYSIHDIPKFTTQDINQYIQSENGPSSVANNYYKQAMTVQVNFRHKSSGSIQAKSQISNPVQRSRGFQGPILLGRWLNRKLLILSSIFFQAIKEKTQENISNPQKDNLYQQQLLKSKKKKSQNQSKQRKNSILRRITQKEQQHEQFEICNNFNCFDKNLNEDIFSLITVKKRVNSIIQPQINKDLHKKFAFSLQSTKFKIQEEPFHHSLQSKFVQTIPRKFKFLERLQPIIAQRVEHDSCEDQMPKMSPLKERKKTNIHQGYYVQSSWINNDSNKANHGLRNNQTQPSIENNQNKKSLTYFGSEAIDFKNSLIKQKQIFKQKSQKIANIQQIERKSMPVKPSILVAQQRKDQNDQGRRKVVKLRSKIKENFSRYQQSQQFIRCSTSNCFGSQVQIRKLEQNRDNYNERYANKKYKCMQPNFGINNDFCLSSQIKDSVASTTFKTSLYDFDTPDQAMDLKNDFIQNSFYRQKSLSCANQNSSLDARSSQLIHKKTMLANDKSINNSVLNTSQLTKYSYDRPNLLKNQSHHSYCSSPQNNNKSLSTKQQSTFHSTSKTGVWRNSLICKRNPDIRIDREQNGSYNLTHMQKIEEKIRRDYPISQKLKYKAYDMNTKKKGEYKRMETLITLILTNE